ncbi:MAG: TonB-dependent receptor [Candidatus Marinimicrobia bacterium]|nr:TonB-dependent receptor [Candidatus Neomarinimicrobiota bacterium]
MRNIFLFLILTGLVWSQTGNLSGLVRDASTHQPLIGVNVIINGTELGAATDMEGYFKIDNVPVGSYDIHLTMIGYEAVSRANVHIVPQRNTVVNFDLHPQVLQGKGVEVTATFFEKTRDAITSSRTVDIEEIRSDPVGAIDIMSMMQSLPSVISGADQTNEIIVRGGSPGENLFVMDHIEIPYPNHFPEQGKGGGPITMIDTDFIERVDFYAGSFPARYGDKLSSVMDVTLREGNRDQHLSEFNLNMAGFGFNFEGPFSQKGSYLFSLKRSFLDFVIQQSGLMAIPKYWTSQGKISYHISPTQKIFLNVIGGIDEINIEGEEDPQLRGAENVDFHSNQLTIGLTYKNLFSKKGYGIISFSGSRVGLNTDVYRNLPDGEKDQYYGQDDLEWETTFKGDWVYRVSPKIENSFGFNIKFLNLDYDNWWEGEPRKIYGYSLSANDPTMPISAEDFWANYFGHDSLRFEAIATIGSYDTIVTKSALDYVKGGIFGQINFKPNPKLEVTSGLRYERVSYTGEGNVSPRLGISYQIKPTLKVNFAGGRYFQPPFNIHLNSPRGNTDELKNYFADQLVVGLEYFLSADTRTTFEVYSKKYEDMVGFDILQDSEGRDSLDYHHLVNLGEGKSQGIEFFIQKKYTNNWYGSFAWSHSVSEGVDPRNGEKYSWDYDYGDVVTLVGGHKIRFIEYDWYRKYKETIFAKATSWLPIAPADEYEIGIKFRYMGGRPYTPKTYDHNIREWYVNSTDAWNTSRYDNYIRFDILLQQRFNFNKMNLVVFWDIMNVFNRDNPWETVYLKNGSTEMAWQFKTFPVGGIILEF